VYAKANELFDCYSFLNHQLLTSYEDYLNKHRRD
jgi:hypothetical protein